MDNERNQHQIIRKDARNCFVESLSDAFAFGKVHLGFATCSITSQRACVQRYLLSQGISPEDFEEIVDDGYSGTNMNRPGIARLLQLADSSRVGTILVRDLSRFSRNYLEAGHYLE